ncbi:glycosyltransferase [Streptomyces albus subsp. chlorinus]|uniref:glycosyltransferase n=1 Tax=Streptomyces albus TaxID=1888 RepID=UPI00156F95E0|nr:glycosyltransferase [Streptomyces albus]NSC24942.1 glycosyltransferase [Streptomyces albus subsp. chlorinus]
MRVLHLITGLGVGGAEEQLRLLLRHLPRHGVRGEVVALTGSGAVAEGIRADGTRVTELGMRGNRDLAALPRLVRLVRAGRYDVVHTHLYRACVYGRIAARAAGVRAVVATEHSLGDRVLEGRPLTPGVRALYLATERLGSTTVAVSDTVAARLRGWGVPAHRLCTVPNGIDAARFRFDPAVRVRVRARLGLPPEAFVVAGVGRLVAGKRFETLVDAVAGVPGARLLLAGDGPERAALRARAGARGAADRVRLLGECPGGAVGEREEGAAPCVPEVLAAADLFVSPSPEEAFGLAVLEALAAGLPVLYAACPAVTDLPAGQAPGARRVPPTADGLGDALRAAYAAHTAATSATAPTATPPATGFRAAGPRRLPVPGAVAHYDIARCAERLARVYASVLGRRPGPGGPGTYGSEAPGTEAPGTQAAGGRREPPPPARTAPGAHSPTSPLTTR